MKRAYVAALVVAGILSGIAAGFYFTRMRGGPPALERAILFETPRPLPEFALVDQAGRTFDRESLRGGWTFLFFGFVNCPDVCPTTLATLAEVRRIAGDLPPGDRPQVALVSVDPARDTPDVLARYVAHFDPEFTGVTGSAGSIDALTRHLGVAVVVGPTADDGSYSVDHTAALFLIDPSARQSALFGSPHDAAVIARDYRRIVAARPR
ncbi:MAG TPA: SCO family protein [Steroidobacteraceae bacterium]